MNRDGVIAAAQAWVDAEYYLVDNLNGNPREGRRIADEVDAFDAAKVAFTAALDELIAERDALRAWVREALPAVTVAMGAARMAHHDGTADRLGVLHREGRALLGEGSK